MKAFTLASTLTLLVLAITAQVASADGSGSPFACFDGPTFQGSSDHLEFTAPDGYAVDGVCISNAANHSDSLGNGAYDNGAAAIAAGSPDACYSIGGVGTQTVTIDSPMTGSNCLPLDHVDIITSCDACDEGSAPLVAQTPPTPEPAAEVEAAQQEAPLQDFQVLPFAGLGSSNRGSATVLTLGLAVFLLVGGFGFGYASRRRK
jgi:hypothetical protein